MEKVRNIFKSRKNSYEIQNWTKIDEKLLKAIQHNDIERVEVILTKKSVLTTKLGPDGFSCFHAACANGFAEIVDLLISCGANVNACNDRAYCGLHLAAHNGFPYITSQLLKAGAEIEYKDADEKTALHHVCNTSYESVVKVLIKGKVNVNALDKKLETPLFYSSYHGHLGICKLLVENGAEINRQDIDKATPLFLASVNEHADVCEYLLQHGADPHSLSKSGMSPYKLSQSSESTQIKNLFKKMATQTKSNSRDSPGNATYETLSTLCKDDDMSLASTSYSPSALRLNSSEKSQGNNLLYDITSSLEDSVFMTVDGATNMPEAEIPSSKMKTEYSTIEKPEGSGISDSDNRTSKNLITKTDVEVAHTSIETRNKAGNKISHGISDRDSRMSENLITKTDVGVAHATIGTRNWADTKISHDALTQNTHTKLASTDIASTDIGRIPIYDDVLNRQAEVTPNMNEVYDDILNKKDTNILYNDSDWTKISREPIYASIRGAPAKEPTYAFIEMPNTAPEKTYSYIHEEHYDDVEKMKASSETKIDLHKTTKVEKKLSKNDSTGNKELKEIIQHQEDKIEKLKLEIKNLGIFLSEETAKNAIQKEKYEMLENMYEATKQQKSVRTSETHIVDMNDKNQNSLEQLEEIESPTKGNGLKKEEEIAVTADTWKENQLLISNNQSQNSKTQADFAIDEKGNDLLAKNECLDIQIEQLSIQLNKVYNRVMRNTSEESIDRRKGNQPSPVQQQNNSLTLELKQLKQDYLHLQKEHKDLVHAGDILQEDYEKLLEERDKMQEILEKVTNSKEITQNKTATLETKNVIQEVPETINPDFDNWEQGEQKITNRHLDTDLRASEQKKPELLEGIIQEKDGLKRNYVQLDTNNSEVLQDQHIILKQLQMLKDENKKLFVEKENAIVDLEISFNENSDLKQKLNTTFEGYRLLEKNYTVLLLEKQNMAAKDISGLDSNNINDSNIQLHSNLQEQFQLFSCQPDEMSIQTKDDNNIQQTPPSKSSVMEETDMQKDKKTELLQLLISQLQQQLIDSEKYYQEIVQTYRLHLISAVQGHIDPDVKNGLFSIIEMRSLEKHC